MKKNGFTLIELIAVIVILSIILLIAVPKINNVLYSSRKKTFETNAYSLVSTAEKLYQNSYAGSLKESGIVYDIENGKILYDGNQVDLVEGKIEGNGFIQIHSNGESKIAIENDEFCAVKQFTDGKITVTDKEEGVACGKIYVAFSYVPNGGVVTQEFASSYLERTKIELLDPTREDYNFLGWEVVKGNSTINNKILTIGNTDTEIYALWANNPAFDIDLLGGTSSQSFNNTYPSGTTMVLEEPTRVGYTFKGWEKEYGNSVISGNDFTMGTEDTKIKAIWEINTYTISYDLVGGTNAEENPISGTYGSTVTINNPTKEEHIFNGWTVSGAAMTGTDLTIGTSDITLTANWLIKTYTMNYDLNGGLFEVSPQTEVPYGSIVVLEKPNKEGYVFAGWEIISGDGLLSGNTYTMGREDTTIKALWKKAQALYTESDNALTFVLSEHEYSVGETYNSKAITNVYTGFDTEIYNLEFTGEENKTNYIATGDAPWANISTSIKSVIFEDIITPISTTGWFTGLENCSYFDVTKLDVSQVEDMGFMFQQAGYNASTFEIVGLDNWDVSNVTNMKYMFSGTGYTATTFNIRNLSNWDVSNVTNMLLMFSKTGYTATTFNIGDLSNWDTSNVTNMSAMFQSTGYTATTFNIGNLGNWDTSKVTDMSFMFSKTGYTATAFNIGNLGNWDTGNVTNMIAMFNTAGYTATTFNVGDLSGWDTSKVTDMYFMFNKTGYTATTFNIGNIGNWDTSNVTNMSTMFQYTGHTATIFNIGDLSNWDTSKVTNMSWMFNESGYTATTFNIGNLDNWNTSNVTNMTTMFQLAGYSATTFNIGNLSGWNTSKVTNMGYMFFKAGYNATYSLNLSSWNVNKVTSYTNFNYGVTGKVTAPTWVN